MSVMDGFLAILLALIAHDVARAFWRAKARRLVWEPILYRWQTSQFERSQRRWSKVIARLDAELEKAAR